MNYPEQLKLIRAIRVKDGESIRVNCPYCLGSNTLGISKQGGVLKWHCFKASCELQGIADYEQSLDGIRSKLHLSNFGITPSRIGSEIPSVLVAVEHNQPVLEYLESVNSLDAYKQNKATIVYSPTEDRAMFGIKYQNKIAGYSGRSLSGQLPKWKKYGDATHLFTCGNGEIGVLVEDAPSACAVGVIAKYTGVSLLGTVLTTQHKLELQARFNRLIICLDKDASLKALQLMRRLDWCDVTIKFLSEDLKYHSPLEISNILEKNYSSI